MPSSLLPRKTGAGEGGGFENGLKCAIDTARRAAQHCRVEGNRSAASKRGSDVLRRDARLVTAAPLRPRNRSNGSFAFRASHHKNNKEHGTRVPLTSPLTNNASALPSFLSLFFKAANPFFKGRFTGK